MSSCILCSPHSLLISCLTVFMLVPDLFIRVATFTGHITLFDLKQCQFFFFFFFLRKVSRALWLCYHRWLDDPSQYDTILSTRQMQTVSESPGSYDSIHLLTQCCYIRESDPLRKYFFCTWPYNQTSFLTELIVDVDQMTVIIWLQGH